ncbi:MAG: 4-hydroxythreonine-4-phosphate dehydrogenase PdxA [Elusimicrobiota bacterium]
MPPVIAVTIGDPAGIGPEIIAKVFSKKTVHQYAHYIIVGHRKFIKNSDHLRNIQIIEPRNSTAEVVPKGKPSKQSGLLSYNYILTAHELIKSGQADAMLTAPVSKTAWQLAGINVTGHTELLAKLEHLNPSKVTMCMFNRYYKTVMVTRHIATKNVASALSVNKILDTITTAYSLMKTHFGNNSPRIGVCGLNPHCGDNGLIGTEEKNIILPAVRLARKHGLNAEGPLPADAMFSSSSRSKFDIIVTMYHDQAMLPLKLTGYNSIVNYTYGLPYIRTSPGHGTAYDITGRGIADTGCLMEALKFAVYALHKKGK